MNKNYGLIFRKLRKERGYSIKEISDSSISNSTISRFENGFNNISIDKFFRLLSNINLSPSEYFLALASEQSIPDFALMLEFSKAFDAANSIEFEKLLAEFEHRASLGDSSKSIDLQTSALRSLLYSLNHHNDITAKEINAIKSHLLSVTIWGIFELQLYSRSIYSFDLDTIYQLSNRLLSPINHGLISADYLHQFYVALINLTDCLNVKEGCQYFEQVIQFLKFHDIPERFGLEKGIISFNIGVYHFKSGKTEQGIQEMTNIIKAFGLLGCTIQANRLSNELDQLSNNPI